MRKVYYGLFLDYMPPRYDACDLIGMHIYIKNAQKAALKTAGYEYYIYEDGDRITIDDASSLEKMRARILFLFNMRKEKILGVRSSKKKDVNPYSDPCPQLGICLDSNGNKKVDNHYYDSACERGIQEDDMDKVLEAELKREEAQQYVNSLEDKPKTLIRK